MKAVFCLSLILSAIPALAEMPVVFPDYKKFDDLGGRDFLMPSTIPGEFKTPEGVVAAMLFLGDQVKDENLTAPFSSKTIKSLTHVPGILPLGSYLRGARIEKGTFIIGFSTGAMQYLNNTAAIQQVVKGAIEATIMKNFPDIKKIDYEIDGEIISDWDA